MVFIFVCDNDHLYELGCMRASRRRLAFRDDDGFLFVFLAPGGKWSKMAALIPSGIAPDLMDVEDRIGVDEFRIFFAG